jgi:hypothetical protein
MALEAVLESYRPEDHLHESSRLRFIDGFEGSDVRVHRLAAALPRSGSKSPRLPSPKPAVVVSARSGGAVGTGR